MHLRLHHSVAMLCSREAGSDFVMHIDTCNDTQGSLEKHSTITDFLTCVICGCQKVCLSRIMLVCAVTTQPM